jgi:hypothetical protein
MTDKELPAFLAVLDAYQGEASTLAALRLLMLTAVRPGELRGARWAEIDADAAVWRIPAERMKMKAAHVVPLSRQALDVLAQQRAISGERELVFPSPFYPGKPLSENTLNSALARMGYKGEHSATGSGRCFPRWPMSTGTMPMQSSATWPTWNGTMCGLPTIGRSTCSSGPPSCSGGRTTWTAARAARWSRCRSGPHDARGQCERGTKAASRRERQCGKCGSAES